MDFCTFVRDGKIYCANKTISEGSSANHRKVWKLLNDNRFKKYFGIVPFRMENKYSNSLSYEETYLSVEAANIDEVEKLRLNMQNLVRPVTPKNNNEPIEVIFEKIIDINEYLRAEPQGNYQEI